MLTTLINYLAHPLQAFAQTATSIDWDLAYTSSTVSSAEDAFVETFFYVITLIAPYAVILGIIWMAIRFFRRRG